jgi:NADH:ubiquinone oxidoreductase subunit
VRTLLRGKPYRPTHEKGGFGDEAVRCVGQDEFGNKYFEDFNNEQVSKN